MRSIVQPLLGATFRWRVQGLSGADAAGIVATAAIVAVLGR